MPTPEGFKKKCLTPLTDIGDKWYLNNMRNPKHPMKKPRLSQRQ